MSTSSEPDDVDMDDVHAAIQAVGVFGWGQAHTEDPWRDLEKPLAPLAHRVVAGTACRIVLGSASLVSCRAPFRRPKLE